MANIFFVNRLVLTTNTFKLKFCFYHENCGCHRFGRLAGVAHSRRKFALRTRLRNRNIKSQFSIFDSFQNISVHIYVFFKFVGVKVGVPNFFLLN